MGPGAKMLAEAKGEEAFAEDHVLVDKLVDGGGYGGKDAELGGVAALADGAEVLGVGAVVGVAQVAEDLADGVVGLREDGGEVFNRQDLSVQVRQQGFVVVIAGVISAHQGALGEA